ncbi:MULTISPECIES: hypothetical protein [unclassified Candidatus Accumulibacter]|uniref:hypothetical protein n=1 Tax=unclassified Candidatus Accumulibacter TaxID=2619054 RepID=UPI0025C5393D|nr:MULTISPECIES: hypothetical protein [unclassified Candidatus Accumulibacter]
MPKPTVLLIGLQPTLINYSDPAYAAFPGMTAERVQAGLDKDVAALNGLGYAAELCLVDFGETAETVLRQRFESQSYDCVLVGAGVRLIAKNTSLFEKLINVVHERAGTAKLCFNTGPTDSADAVRRWIPNA